MFGVLGFGSSAQQRQLRSRALTETEAFGCALGVPLRVQGLMSIEVDKTVIGLFPTRQRSGLRCSKSSA